MIMVDLPASISKFDRPFPYSRLVSLNNLRRNYDKKQDAMGQGNFDFLHP